MKHDNHTTRASLDQVLASLREWKSEAKNFRNDGWVQSSYEEKLKKVFEETKKALHDLRKNK